MPNRRYDPSTLGRIDAVDVVALDASARVGSVSEFIRSSGALGEIRLTDEDAERIAALWRALPSGKQARCHSPPYGLRFWLAGRKLLEASICWECDNVFGYAGDDTLHFAFEFEGSRVRVAPHAVPTCPSHERRSNPALNPTGLWAAGLTPTALGRQRDAVQWLSDLGGP